MSEAARSRCRSRAGSAPPRRLSLSAPSSRSAGRSSRAASIELWAHKLRSTLTLTLLMLGVFALVVMTSVMDGVMDKIATGFSGMSWDGTVMLAPDSPATTEEQKRFAMSPGLRCGGPAAPDRARIRRSWPTCRARPSSRRSRSRAAPSGCWINGVWPDYGRWMNRPIAMGRGLTDDDERRRSTVAVVGATLGSKLFGGADPVGRDITVEGVALPRRRRPGAQPDLHRGALVRRQRHLDPAPDLHGPDRLRATSSRTSRSSSRAKRDMAEVSAMMIGRAKQAHHGIEDVEDQGPRGRGRARVGALPRPDLRLEGRAHEPGGDGAARRRRRGPLGDAHLVLRPPLRDRPAQGHGRFRLRDPGAVPARGLRARRRRRDVRDVPRHRRRARPCRRTSPTASSSTRWACSSPGSPRSSSRSPSASTPPSAPRACRPWRRCGNRRSGPVRDLRPEAAPASGSPGCRLDRSPDPEPGPSLPRREPPPSLRSGDYSRRERMFPSGNGDEGPFGRRGGPGLPTACGRVS